MALGAHSKASNHALKGEFVEMYPLITFSYKGHLLGEPKKLEVMQSRIEDQKQTRTSGSFTVVID